MSSKRITPPGSYSPRLYGEIAECHDYSSLENTLLSSVAKKIGAETSTLLHFQRDHDGYEIGHNLAYGVGNKIHNQYVDKFHRSDPILLNRDLEAMHHSRADAHTDVYRLSDVCDPGAFVETEYYNDFLKPSGIRHVLALAVKPKTVNNDLLVIIGFHRPAGMRDFGDNALNRAISIAPIVGSTIARLTFKEHLTKYKLLSENLKSVLDNTGYLILDAALQIKEMSDCVRSLTYGNLPFLMQRISQAVSSLIKSGRQHINISAVCTDIDRTALNQNINFAVSKTISENGVLRFIVRLGFVHTNIAITRCADEFGWTLREGEIVMTLAQGLSNTQISENLMISVRTVENHLRSVYSKAAVTSRTQLLRQLLSYTPPQHISRMEKI